MTSTARILHITTGLGLGGAEKILFDLAQHQASKGSLAAVVSLNAGGYYGSLLKDNGVRLIEIPLIHSNRGIVWHIFRLATSTYLLIKVLHQLRPNLVHTWMYPADIFGGLISKLFGIPVVWGIFTGHTNSQFYRPRTFFLFRLCILFSKFIPSQIVSCSAFGRHSHSSVGYDLNRIRYIPSGFEVPSQNTRPTLFSSSINTKNNRVCTIGMLGRFTKEKDHFLLLKAVAILKRKGHQLNLILAGSTGIDHHNIVLTDFIDKHGLKSNTTLMSSVPNTHTLFSKLDVFSLISSSEGFPTVVGEAMAYGLPCIVSNVGDSKILLNDTKQLVSVGNLSELVHTIEYMINMNESSRASIGERNSKRITQHFTKAKMVNRYIALYKHSLK